MFAHFMAFNATVFPKDDLEFENMQKIPHNVEFPTIHTVPFDSDELIRLHGFAVCESYFKNSTMEKSKAWNSLTNSTAFLELREEVKKYLKGKGSRVKKFKKIEEAGKLDDVLWFKGISNLGDYGLADMRF